MGNEHTDKYLFSPMKKCVQNTGFPGHGTVFDLGHLEVKLPVIFIEDVDDDKQ